MDLLQEFERMQSLYPPSVARRAGRILTTGVSSRLGSARMRGLMGTREAKALTGWLDTQPLDRVKRLRVLAALNEEQARGALRTTLIANITVPLIALAVLNQTFPGWHTPLTSRADEPAVFGILLLTVIPALLVIAGIGFFAVSYSNHARDLRQLCDVAAAKRGVYFGAEDADETGIDYDPHE